MKTFKAKVIAKNVVVRAGAVVELSPIGANTFRVVSVNGKLEPQVLFLMKGDFDFVEGDHGIKEEV